MTTTKSNHLTTPASLLAVSNPEVQPSTSRVNWTVAKKPAILAEYESFVRGAPERGALLRRHGIYTSHISKWRDQRNRGALAALSPQPRGPKPTTPDPLVVENARLQRDIARLQAPGSSCHRDRHPKKPSGQ